MTRANALVILIAFYSLTACAQLGIKSLPWSTNVEIHDSEAMDFMREVPRVRPELGENLAARSPLEDGHLVAVSVSGGGMRAAAFTLGILAELQMVQPDRGGNALDQLDFISSNSGGSWGVAAYLMDRASSRSSTYNLAERVDPTMIGQFERTSDGRVPCWTRAMRERFPMTMTYRDVYSPENPIALPRAFFNAALLPSHSPFVFDQNFINYYQVERFGACPDGDWVEDFYGPQNQLADLPFGYAAATSGTVPGFYYSYATTGLCNPETTSGTPSFCHASEEGRRRQNLRLADGGLYDNLAYKTAFEILSADEYRDVARKTIILVNSNTSTGFHTVPYREIDDSFLLTTASNGIFAVQDSTFDRFQTIMFEAIGVEPILLDFYSVSGFTENDVGHLRGLDALAHFAAHNVTCYVGTNAREPQGRNTDRPASVDESVRHLMSRGGDCLSENFYRAGTLGKTTYQAEENMFRILYQLGRLAVRMHRREIIDALER